MWQIGNGAMQHKIRYIIGFKLEGRYLLHVQTLKKVRGPFFERLTQRESRVERRARRQPIERGSRIFLDVCM